jgi:hypothetical protein
VLAPLELLLLAAASPLDELCAGAPSAGGPLASMGTSSSKSVASAP